MITIITIVILVIIGITSFVNLAPQFGCTPQNEHLEKISQSPQYHEKGFQNSGNIDIQMGFAKGIEAMWKWINGAKDQSPVWSIPVKEIDKSIFKTTVDTLVRATWFGHSTFLLEIDGQNLLLDPMLGSASAPVSFIAKRFNNTLPLAIEEFPIIDAVLFSHDHYDHLDYWSVVRLKDKVKHFYVPLGLGSHLKKWGVAANKITELDWWQSTDQRGIQLVATPAQHFSGRTLNDRNKTLWCSWVINGKNVRIFFNGDSGYFEGFKKIGQKYGPFDLCLLECGQYNELWKEIHMMPEQTAQAHLDLKGKILVPIHWGAFNLSVHSWTEPIRRIIAAAQKNKSTITTPMIGESIILGEKLPQSYWWEKD